MTRFPRAALRAGRVELTRLPLRTVAGRRPDDLRGHVFLVAPVGDPGSAGLPRRASTPYLNGDGMVFRLDLDPDAVRVSSRLARVPSWWADVHSLRGTRHEGIGFRNAGISRMNVRTLGARCFANTAVVPLRWPGRAPRLLATYDAGRPFEVDPWTLEVVAPVGALDEWRPTMLPGAPFPMLQSCAHPAFDGRTGELFSVSFGRSYRTILETIPAVGAVTRTAAFRRLRRATRRPRRGLRRQVARAGLHWPETFFDLLVWDGEGALRRHPVVTPDGEPLRVRETMHQIAVTERHVVLMDTAFKFSAHLVLDEPLPGAPGLERATRRALARPQQAFTVIYLVRRSALRDGAPVVARPVVVPFETVHWMVDYEEPGGRVVVHLAHQCAMDGAEFLKGYERTADGRRVDPALRGMFPGACDVSRLARHAIDPERGEVVSSRTVADARRTWGVGLGTAWRFPNAGPAPARTTDIYWYAQGHFPELVTEQALHLYARYPLRQTSRERLAELAEGAGPPGALFRLHTPTMTIADAWEVPPGGLLCTPQHVPRPDADGATDGYLTTCWFGPDDEKELWVFRADDLAAGPVCRLTHPALDWGYTLHSAYLDRLAPRDTAYAVSAERDWGERARRGDAVGALLREAVLPNAYVPRDPVGPPGPAPSRRPEAAPDQRVRR
ncbi:MAG TPA: carotenoid oxygenase family protein [Sandaracinaceae bacterium LLY-WYZ-13_1]|nr:carotenoid oxygenase family protein [Sandaracinaceae bacterium LLY-WYZ-13_1]